MVEDSYFFWPGDLIKIGGSLTRSITSIDYDTHTLTLGSPASWTNGDGVSLNYNGSAPDIGAYEY
jgi:hypothetical protein